MSDHDAELPVDAGPPPSPAEPPQDGDHHRFPPDRSADTEAATGADDEAEETFDVHALPGGARGAVEAVLMVVDQPVTAGELATALELPETEVVDVLEDLEREYAQQQRGFTIRCINDGWRIYSRPAYAPAVEKFLLDGQQARLTQASLETLAVIAYRQPISRSRISAVRGVNVDGVVRTLLTRGLIVEVGVAGDQGATLYGTTPHFLQRLGIGSLEELPALAPYLPDADVVDELIAQGHG